jgi:hypothetical protein
MIDLPLIALGIVSIMVVVMALAKIVTAWIIR